MRGFILCNIGLLFIINPFTIIIGLYIFSKGLDEIEKRG